MSADIELHYLYILKQCSTEVEGAVHVIKKHFSRRIVDRQISAARGLAASGDFGVPVVLILTALHSSEKRLESSRFIRAVHLLKLAAAPVAPLPSSVSGVFTIYTSVPCKVVWYPSPHPASLAPTRPRELRCRRLLRTPRPCLQHMRRRGKDATSGEWKTMAARRGHL
jgi:hypothetical protein